MISNPPPEDLWLGDPVIAPLLSALTAEAAPGELAGQHSTLAMFRTAGAARAAAARRRRARRRARLATVASIAAVAAGFAAAGYAAVLPAPLQRAAYRYLGFAGFPDAHHRVPTSGGDHASGRPAVKAGRAGPSASAGPGSQAPGTRAQLGPRGSQCTLVGTRGRPDVISVRCPLGTPGDVVKLQEWSGSKWRQGNPGKQRPGTWRTVQSGRLGETGRVSFNVTNRHPGSAYRVVVSATPAHRELGSNVLTVFRRHSRARPSRAAVMVPARTRQASSAA